MPTISLQFEVSRTLRELAGSVLVISVSTSVLILLSSLLTLLIASPVIASGSRFCRQSLLKCLLNGLCRLNGLRPPERQTPGICNNNLSHPTPLPLLRQCFLEWSVVTPGVDKDGRCQDPS